MFTAMTWSWQAGRKFAKIAADRIFRNAKFGSDGAGDDLALGGQAGKQELFAVIGEHGLHDNACYCMILHES